jgi:hypothetical protein
MRTTSSPTSRKPWPADRLAVYTALQLFEVLVASAVVMFGVVTHRSAITLLGAGFLIGKAILNILAPEGGSVYRRSLIGYVLAGAYVLVGVILVHFSG